MIALITLSFAGILSMISGIFKINTKALIAVLVLLLCVASAVSVLGSTLNFNEELINKMILFDNYALAFSAVISILTIFVLLTSEHYLSKIHHYQGEFLSLILFSAVGMVCMISYKNLSMLFVGIEIMSVPLYILAGSNKHNLLSNESSLKYFLMGAFTTGVLLMGIALVYGATQTFDCVKIGEMLTNGTANSPLLYLGIFFLIFAFLFKVSAFPFHAWTPDVYQGAPTWVTSFMATIVKVAGFGAFFRLFLFLFDSSSITLNIQLTVSVLAAITITIGSLSAVFQNNIKRILAYSSISHAGYMLISITFANHLYNSTILYYTIAYSISSLALFGVLMSVESKTSIFNIESFNGFAKKNSFMAFVAAVALISMAGIPPTAGFIAKFSVLKLAVNNQYTWLAIIGVLNAIIGVFYYLKLIIAMYFKNAENDLETIEYSNSLVYNLVLLVLVVLIIGLGLFSDLIINLF